MLRICHFPDPDCRQLRLKLHRIQALIIRLRRLTVSLQKQKFRIVRNIFSFCLRKYHSRIKSCLIIIVNPTETLLHDLTENIIHARKYTFPASEIL